MNQLLVVLSQVKRRVKEILNFPKVITMGVYMNN